MRQKLFTEIFILFSDKKILWRYSYHDEITQESNSVIDISRRTHGIGLSVRNAERTHAPTRQAHKQNGARLQRTQPRVARIALRPQVVQPRTRAARTTQRLQKHIQTVKGSPCR